MTWSRKMKRYHGADPWGRDSYDIPLYAVAGSSATGNEPDSPAPADAVEKEINQLRKYLKRNGIKTRILTSQSGNLFMAKVWVVTEVELHATAKSLSNSWLREHERTTHYIHDAD